MRAGLSLPDYRNIARGCDWMRRIVEASERMDRGDKDAMWRMLGEIDSAAPERRVREPGEDDD